MSAPFKQLAIAYIPLDPEASAAQVLAQEQQFRDYAEERGYELCQIEFNSEDGLPLGRLVGLLQRHGAEHLLVPSVKSLTSHPIAELVIREAVTLEARAELHEVCAPTELTSD
ncbi:hypothetical protein ACFWP7_42045 [Streptomyces sp. NPDC058470]|uniref:hypothetical protein n=1 Tax=Streptomyces sp. NPDC058470 TaxID=3346515 RepID=UPI0036656FD4